MGGNEMRKHALRRYVICRIKDIELIHLNLILSELRENKFTPENLMGHKSDDFARSMQIVGLGWFATLVDQSRDGLNIFDVWRQLFPKHLDKIDQVWKEIEPAWNIIRTHRDKVAFHADKPSVYFKAMFDTAQNMDSIVKALDGFLALSSFFSKIEGDELPEFNEVTKEMIKEIGEQLGCEINPEWFRKLLLPSKEEAA